MTLHFEKSGSKYDRLSYIYDRLSRSPDGVTIKDLAEELKVSTKTVQRDLHEALSGSGVYCDGRRWKLSRNSAEDGLANEERIVLGVLDSLAKHAGPAFYNKAHQLLEQVTCQLDHPLFASLDSETLSEEHLKTFTLLENAIKSRNLISAAYTSVNKKRRNVKLKPLRLAFFDGYWYLLAFDAESKDTFKKFHLKSLSTITTLDETFTYPKEIAETIEKAFSVWFTLNEPFEVRLWVEKEIAPYFERKPYHGQSIEGRDADGSIEVVLRVTDEMEVLPIVQWYLPHIRILEPEWMNDMLMEKIAAYTKVL
ncbi:transcriptional regulator [Sulfuricurvum sp.]|uniref:helix-turn-helix transcriptional regulator n=1 Tax=Sulfuricurvum sp. TaxID=2025608 RepID=UPI002602D986|nr:transcriptional regulator [Sulfuricurvum sp.]MDD3595893.1 transcriptional regulator [Sulfuricurvum sp.]